MLYTPSHAELAQHPKTRKLARQLGVSIPTAIGHLHLLWHFALKYAPDGDLSRFTDEDIADGCLWEGNPGTLYDALSDAKFVDLDGDSWTLHDWQDYGGKAIKQKEDNAKRQQEWRDRHKTVSQPSPNKPVTVTSPLPNALDNKRVDKKKEEEKKTPPIPPTPSQPKVSPPSGGVSVRAAPKPSLLNAEERTAFEEWYRCYPNKQHRPEAERAWAKLKPDHDLLTLMIGDVETRKLGRKWAEGYIEHPATYLTNRVWEDDIEPVRMNPPVRATHTSGFQSDDAFAKNIQRLRAVGRVK